MLTLFILSYTLGAVVTYGASFAWFQRNFPSLADNDYYKDIAVSLFAGVFWCVGGLLGAFLGAKRGLFQSGLKFY